MPSKRAPRSAVATSSGPEVWSSMRSTRRLQHRGHLAGLVPGLRYDEGSVMSLSFDFGCRREATRRSSGLDMLWAKHLGLIVVLDLPGLVTFWSVNFGMLFSTIAGLTEASGGWKIFRGSRHGFLPLGPSCALIEWALSRNAARLPRSRQDTPRPAILRERRALSMVAMFTVQHSTALGNSMDAPSRCAPHTSAKVSLPQGGSDTLRLMHLHQLRLGHAWNSRNASA